MKKKQARSRRPFLRRASRAEGRRSRALMAKVRMPTAASVPWDKSTDCCQFYLAAESYSERPMPGAVDPLTALDERFRQTAGWTRQGGQEPTRALNVVVGMQRPKREFVAASGRRFVAVDPLTYEGAAVRDRVGHQQYWEHQTNGRPFSMPFLKSALAIWRKLRIEVPPENTAYMMQMKSVDSETSEAIQAALWSAFNTARYPIDIETAVFVLATFMHADPLRKHLVSNEIFVEPYGDRTQYGLIEVYDLAAEVDGYGREDER